MSRIEGDVNALRYAAWYMLHGNVCNYTICTDSHPNSSQDFIVCAYQRYVSRVKSLLK